MLLGIDGTSSRRRRSTGDLTNAIGGTLTSDGDDQIKQKVGRLHMCICRKYR
jgi:hypothetical protein